MARLHFLHFRGYLEGRIWAIAAGGDRGMLTAGGAAAVAIYEDETQE